MRHLSDRKHSALRSQLIAYLAETMPETQRQGFEQRLLDDDIFSKQIHQAQQELLEEYADGALSAVHRKQLGPWIFYSANRRQNVQLTADLLYRARRSKTIAMRLYVGMFAACLLIFVGLALLRSVRHVEKASEFPTTPAKLPPPNFAASNDPMGFGDSSGTGNPEASSPVKPAIVRLVPEHVHGDSLPANGYIFGVPVDVPVLLQMLVSASSHCDYSVTLHAETAAIPDRHRDHLDCLEVQGAKYVDVDLPPGSLPPGQYTVRLTSTDGILMTRFIVHL